MLICLLLLKGKVSLECELPPSCSPLLSYYPVQYHFLNGKMNYLNNFSWKYSLWDAVKFLYIKILTWSPQKERYENFTAALFVIVKNWKKKIKCPSTGKRINKLMCIYIRKYYSVIKKNKSVIQSLIKVFCERSQTEKSTFCMIPFI